MSSKYFGKTNVAYCCSLLHCGTFPFSELNAMPCRPPKERLIYHEENLDTDLPVVTTVPDLADHHLGNILFSLHIERGK